METPIIHVDMDAFFAAVEIRDDPRLEGKPVIIGGDPKRDVRAVVSTASYEARKYGVHSAMPLLQAWKLCPHGVFLRGRMASYARESKRIMEILSRFTPLVEPISIDEAFLDVRGCERLFGTPVEIARCIQQTVQAETGLSCSVGVAANKFLAKLASDLDKPGGLTVIRPDQVEQILHPLPIEKLWGVGAKTAAKLRRMGIETVGQLARLDRQLLTAALGKLGDHVWHLARGRDVRPVELTREVKSLSRETTFAVDIHSRDRLNAVVLELAEDVARRLREQGLRGETVTLKLRYGNFQTVTRQGPLPAATCLTMPLYAKAMELLDKIPLEGRGVRLVGLGVSRLVEGAVGRQVSLFEPDKEQRELRLAEVVDRLSARYGAGSVRRAALIGDKKDDNGSRQ